MQVSQHKHYPELDQLLQENTSIAKMLPLVGRDKRVVDFGCATGYLANLLTQEGCKVTGVEINSEAAKVAEAYCDKVIVADLDYTDITELLAHETYDVAVFGDVLEHLRDPWRVLRATQKILNPDGYLVASIPNIAHGAIRLALLEGRFEYTELGILDNTHLRFFTRPSLYKLFEDTGFFVESIAYTTLPIFSDSDLIPQLERNRLSDEIVKQVESDRDAEVLQFIVRAYPWSMSGKYAALEQKYDEANKNIFELIQENNNIQAELQHTQTELQHTQAELQHTQTELQHTQAELQHTQTQLQGTQAVSMNQQQVIQAMENSKFWQLQKVWFRVKSSIGLQA
jgi:2-polyprenyl-3-methyl-5-hydroxy-6-metoxy-1,4-benzoquinol methylase